MSKEMVLLFYLVLVSLFLSNFISVFHLLKSCHGGVIVGCGALRKRGIGSRDYISKDKKKAE